MTELLTLLPLITCVWLVLGGIFLGYRYRDQIGALWHEPILRYPIMIFESDDWGAGPDSQVEALKAITAALSRYKDAAGHHPVMTLAMIMAEPDFQRIRADSDLRYVAKRIDARKNQAFFKAIEDGLEREIYSLHLHGMEHYWPDSLMAALKQRVDVGEWFSSSLRTEQLPSELQSRWTDGAHLPSSPLSMEAIKKAVAEEVRTFTCLFGCRPQVVVPPTFVWNEAVESQWALQGLNTVVTPGKRFVSRDVNGLQPDREDILSGQAGVSGITYLVRDAYFEPVWRHQPEQGLNALIERSDLGRATLFEIHRFNFLDDLQLSLDRLEQLIQAALARYPELRFISTLDLADAIRSNDAKILVNRRVERWTYLLRRIKTIPGFRRLGILSGSWFVVSLAESILTTRVIRQIFATSEDQFSE